jgi:hypothetical protein
MLQSLPVQPFKAAMQNLLTLSYGNNTETSHSNIFGQKERETRTETSGSEVQPAVNAVMNTVTKKWASNLRRLSTFMSNFQYVFILVPALLLHIQ